MVVALLIIVDFGHRLLCQRAVFPTLDAYLSVGSQCLLLSPIGTSLVP